MFDFTHLWHWKHLSYKPNRRTLKKSFLYCGFCHASGLLIEQNEFALDISEGGLLLENPGTYSNVIKPSFSYTLKVRSTSYSCHKIISLKSRNPKSTAWRHSGYISLWHRYAPVCDLWKRTVGFSFWTGHTVWLRPHSQSYYHSRVLISCHRHLLGVKFFPQRAVRQQFSAPLIIYLLAPDTHCRTLTPVVV